MEGSTPNTVTRDQTSAGDGGKEVTAVTVMERNSEIVTQYVQKNSKSKNTQLFSLMALLNAYVPESYLLMSECQQILGPPDLIHGGPPFEERMEPFKDFIHTSDPSPAHVCMIDQMHAQRAVELLADLGISRSATAKNLIVSLCGNEFNPHVTQLIKDLLLKREMGEKRKETFSRLIEDIIKHENFHKALSVLKKASDNFRQNAFFPQAIARLYYIQSRPLIYEKAEEWAKEAIRRAPDCSYVADTVGQIYKNRLFRKAWVKEGFLKMVEKAFKAFKNVEVKADREVDPEMSNTAGAVSRSNTFNNRGHFGFIQVAKIAFENTTEGNDLRRDFIKNYKEEVERKFDFFEWYLTYSKPSMTTLEPLYFWKDVALCYKHYTKKTAAESTSFPALFDCLNHGLFTSKGRRANFVENEKTVSDLEAIRNTLKTTYEEGVNDIKVAETYILSNVILSNRIPISPQLTPVKELQTIIHRFWSTEERYRSPEFYLLVLLLFWPEEQPQAEMEQQIPVGDWSEGTTLEDEDRNEEQETNGEPTQLPLDLATDPNLQQSIALMEKAFERAKYAKYLYGRYLLPLFFLGKGSGLSKWIHKSRLDIIVEKRVDADIANEQNERHKNKESRINDMWSKGQVWQLPEINHILLPVRVEPQGQEEQRVYVSAGQEKISASTEVKLDASKMSRMPFYLGFTIQGPVVFQGGVPQESGQ